MISPSDLAAGLTARAAALVRQARVGTARALAGDLLAEMETANRLASEALAVAGAAIAERDAALTRLMDEGLKLATALVHNAAFLDSHARELRMLNRAIDDIAEAAFSIGAKVPEAAPAPPRPAEPFRPTIVAGKDRHDDAS